MHSVYDGRALQQPITFAEVLNSLRHLKAGKAPGKDGLHAEFYMRSLSSGFMWPFGARTREELSQAPGNTA